MSLVTVYYSPGTNSSFDYPSPFRPLNPFRRSETGGTPRRLTEAIGASRDLLVSLTSPKPDVEIINDQAMFFELDRFINGLTNNFSAGLGQDYQTRIEAVLNSQVELTITADDARAWAEELVKRLESFDG